jgi:TM2 domain-containing membrane protein YozV
MVYCKHCGKEFISEEITYCPSCGKSQNLAIAQAVVITQNKNPGFAVLIALIAGLFGFQGIGHIYTGKTAKGIVLLLIGWALGISIILVTIGGIIPMSIILGIGVLGYWIWQAYDANKLAKYYNEYLIQNGRSPW